MKNLLSLVVVSTILCSCPDMGESKYYKYSIENKSGTHIEIIPYISNEKKIEQKKVIPNGGSLQKTLESPPPYTSALTMRHLITDSYDLTGIEIIFDNNKKIIYEVCPNLVCSNERNIFDIEYGNDEIEVYTITPEDYQNATDCNGNCY